MAISLASLKRSGQIKPPRILLYGVQGVGKTTFGAGAPNPVFIQTEDGLDTISGVSAFDLVKGSFDDVMAALSSLYSEKHDFQTLVVDSIDWLEPKIWEKTAKDNNWSSVEQPGYGKGYIATLDYWRSYLEGLNALRDERGMTIIQLAHSQIKRFESPEHEPYDRYEIKLHKQAAALLQEHSDAVLFANYWISTVKTESGFNKKSVRGVGNGSRVLYTSERPSFLAKNRYGLPDKLDFPRDGAWQAFADAVSTNRDIKQAA